MHKQMIRIYMLVIGISFLLSLLLSVILIEQYYDAGKAFLLQRVLICFVICCALALWVAYLLGRRLAKTHRTSLEKISARAREFTHAALKDGALADYASAGEVLKLQQLEDRVSGAAQEDEHELDQVFAAMAAYLQQVNMVLLRNNTQLQAVLQNMDEGIISFDDEGRLRLLTDKSLQFLGEAKKQRQRLALLGQNYTRLDQLIESQRERTLPLVLEMTTNYPEERVLGVYVTTLQGVQALPRDHAGMLIVLQDLTRIKQLERLRKDFVANVTHELKTPLTSICGYIELLRSSERDAKTRQTFYEIISIEADRLMSLIQDLLTLSELEHRPNSAMAKESCLLAPILKELFANLQPLAAEKEVTLSSDIPPQFFVPGRAEQQHQILSNLLSNSIMYNNPGGFVRLSGGIERDMVVLRVEDNGIGIAKEDQERIFERFYRVYKERSRFLGGTGLGLSIVKHMVQMLGGTVRLDSELGHGSSFTMMYPLMDKSSIKYD